MNVFSCNNISKRYSKNGFELKDINLNLKSGEITGVVGENGNGKTTLLRIIAGDLAHDSGNLSYYGDNSIEFLTWDKIKYRVAYIPQRIPRWYGYLKDNLIFAAAIRNIKGKQAEELVDNLVHQLGIEKYIHLKWKEISTGYRLRFQLAKMLIGSPELLVLDEPIANLDINAQSKFMTDLRSLVSQPDRNTSVILSSQQLHEIENVSDNILFLKQGEVVYSGKVSKIGEERTTNEFELQSNISIDKLKELFPEIISGINGKIINITLPTTIEAEDFIKTIIEQQFKIEYFRNISSSTKKLFK